MLGINTTDNYQFMSPAPKKESASNGLSGQVAGELTQSTNVSGKEQSTLRKADEMDTGKESPKKQKSFFGLANDKIEDIPELVADNKSSSDGSSNQE